MEKSVAVINVRGCPTSKETEDHTEENLDGNSYVNIGGEDASYWNSLYTLAAFVPFAVIASAGFLIPRKNSMIYQEYWYESIPIFLFSQSTDIVAYQILSLYSFTRAKFLLTIDHFAKVFVASGLLCLVPYCTSYLIWTYHLGYNHPLPLLAILVTWFELFPTKFLFFPIQLKSRKDLKAHGKAYLMFEIWHFLQIIPQEIISLIANSQNQWVLLLLIPFARELSIKVSEKIVKRFPQTDNEETKFFVTTVLLIDYTFQITAKVASYHQSTVYGILIVEMSLHIYGCYQIIKRYSRIGGQNESNESELVATERNIQVKNLATSEFTEAIAPIAFAIAFTLVVYGPNSVLMNGIGNNYFGGEPIEDVVPQYIAMLQMFSFDFVAMIISWASLKYFCQIDLLEAFCNMIRKHWIIFAIHLPKLGNTFAGRDVNFGMDVTSKKFLWITDEGRMDLIRNATELTDTEKFSLLQNVKLW